MKTSRFVRLFGERSPAVIGMIHVRALPGAPGHAGGMGPILDQALAEAEIYRACGLQALMIENMHDVPYVRRPGPEVLAAMAVLAREVKRAHPAVPLGIQILAGANREALSAALAAGADAQTAVQLANLAAGVVVAKLGTATASPEEILAHAQCI